MADDTLPTEDEIRQLPRWARVAFVARCARRALPSFQKHWPDAPIKHVEAVQRAVEMAEQSATIREPLVDDGDATAVRTASDAALVADDDDGTGGAAYAAACAAADAGYTALGDDPQATSRATAVVDAVRAVAIVGESDVQRTIRSLRRDFQRILDQSLRQKWTADTPVPPSVFGPLDEPQPSRTEAFAKYRLTAKAYLNDGVDPQVARQKLRALYNALNDYCIHRWGKGLTVEDFKQFVLAEVPVEV